LEELDSLLHVSAGAEEVAEVVGGVGKGRLHQ
jgi:hypothetical protein